MISPFPNQTTSPPAEKPANTLHLGNREDIGLVGDGLRPDAKRNGKITANLYTGFKDEDGRKQIVQRRTGTDDRNAALKRVNEEFLPELFKAWDKKKEELDQNPKNGGAKPETGLPEKCLAKDITDMLKMWKKRELYPRSFPGYQTSARAFLRCADSSARQVGHRFDENECRSIRDKILAGCNPNSNGPKQTMGNLRFVLVRVEQFPKELVKVFTPERRKRGQVETEDYAFLPSDRKALWENRGRATPSQLGLLLLGANFSVHATDAANALCSQLREAREAIARGERVKTGNPFSNAMWDLTQEWVSQTLTDPDAIFVFPEFVFGPRALKQNPNLNHIPLNESENKTKERRAKAAARASECFDEYLDLCQIKRPGISYRSFRHTNISHWDAEGVPRRVGMSTTGQSEEKNYTGYISTTVDQLRSLAAITLDIYQDPEKRRRYLLTLNQLFDELVKHLAAMEQRADEKACGRDDHSHARFDELVMMLNELRDIWLKHFAAMQDFVAEKVSKLEARLLARIDVLTSVVMTLVKMLGQFLGGKADLSKMLNASGLGLPSLPHMNLPGAVGTATTSDLALTN